MNTDRVRRLSIALTLLTGAAGLIYEVVWQRYLANLLGSQAAATALILAVFLGGLSVGYLLFGLLSRNRSPRALLRMCGAVEIIIGLWALLFPQLFALAWGLALGTAEPSFMLNAAIAILLIGVPTACMGGTLPLLTQSLSHDLEDAPRFHTSIYAINTGGAFFGCLLAGFVLIPDYGLPLTLLGTALINIVAGLILGLAARSLSPDVAPQSSIAQPKEQTESPRVKGPGLSLTGAVVIAALSGAISITLQTVVVRLIGLSMGSSEYAFAMAVAAFILILALGAAVFARETVFVLPVWSVLAIAVVGLIGLHLSVQDWPYVSHVVRTLFTSQAPNFYIYHATMFVLLCLVLAVPVGALGSILPILFRTVRRDFSDLGRSVGYIYGANTLGCVIGAVCGGYWALYWVNLDKLMFISILFAISTSIFALSQSAAPRRLLLGIGIPLALLPFTLSTWPKTRLAMGTFRMTSANDTTYSGPTEFYRSFLENRKLLAYRDDPNTSIGIIDTGGARSIYVNGKSDGSTVGGDRETTKILAHLGALLTGGTSGRAAIIGFGTGITAGSLSLFDNVKDIRLMELVRAVRKFSPYFDKFNHAASKSSKLHWVMNDAYRSLLTTNKKFDMILSEPSNPWVTGIERLYTKDFYAVARKKLVPHGIYAQWFHTYSISEDTLAMVLNTFASEFSTVHLFAVGYDLIIVGSQEPIGYEALQRAQQRLSAPAIQEDLRDIGISNLSQLLAREVPINRRAFRSAGLHTLDYPKLAHHAGYDFFLGKMVNPLQFVELPQYRLANRLAQADSLLNISLGDLAGVERARRRAQVLCNTPEPAMNPGWRRSTALCQSALVQLEIANGPKNSSSREIQVLRTLSRDSDEMPPVFRSSQEVMEFVKLFADFGWLVPDVDPERVKRFTGFCDRDLSYSGTACRVMRVEAFAWNGFASAAKADAASLKHEHLLPAQKRALQAAKQVANQSLARNSKKSKETRPAKG